MYVKLSFICWCSRCQTLLHDQPAEYKLSRAQVDNLIKKQAIISKYTNTPFIQLKASARNAVLVAKDREAILTFVPEWYRSGLEPIIKARNKKYGGQQIYVVVFPYDSTKEYLTKKADYITKVSILKNTGEPLILQFATRWKILYFGGKSYAEWKKEWGQKVPYVPGTKHPNDSNKVWIE